MPRAGPRKVQRSSFEFKFKAVKLSQLPGVQVQALAEVSISGRRFGTIWSRGGVRQSMTRGGAPGENSHVESFFHSCKADVIHGRDFRTIGELRRTLRWYLPFYNHQRRHSALGYQSPVDYERRAA